MIVGQSRLKKGKNVVNPHSLSFRCYGYLACSKRTVSLAKIGLVCCFLGLFAIVSNIRERSGVCERRVGYDNSFSSGFVGRNRWSDLV